MFAIDKPLASPVQDRAAGGLKLLGRNVDRYQPIPTGLVKVKRVEKPATKERMGRNPATGEPMVISAKPKRTVVKALALKTLKEMAQG